MKRQLAGIIAIACAMALSAPSQAADKTRLGLKGYFVEAPSSGGGAALPGTKQQFVGPGSNGTFLAPAIDSTDSVRPAALSDGAAGLSTPYLATDVRAKNSDLYLPNLGPLNLPKNFANESGKVISLSPEVEGLRIGLSLLPGDERQGPDLDRAIDDALSGRSVTLFASNADLLEIGASYKTSISDFELGLGGAFLTADKGRGNAVGLTEGWRMRGEIGLGNVALGSSYRELSGVEGGAGLGFSESTYSSWDAGISYRAEDWRVGAAYIGSDLGKSLLKPSGKGQSVELTGGYKFGTGLELNAGVQLSKLPKLDLKRSGTSESKENSAVLFLETQLTF